MERSDSSALFVLSHLLRRRHIRKAMYASLCALLFLPFTDNVLANTSANIRLLGDAHDFVEQSFDVAMADGYAYISSGTCSGLRVVDLSDPTEPVEIGHSINTDQCPDVAMWMADRIVVSGDRAFVLYFDGLWSFTNFRLYVYDVSDPALPQQMGYISLPDNCTSHAVDGEYVYVTAADFEGFSGVKVIDVSDPQHPVEIGSFETPGSPHEVCVAGQVAYVADGNSLVAYDVADANAPSELGSYSPEGETFFIHHVAVQDDYIYIIDSMFGVRILDGSDLSEIREVGSFPHNQSDAYFSRMKVSGDLAYYLQNGDNSEKKLCILDVSNPAAPTEIGAYSMPGDWWFYGFDHHDGYACVAGGSDGLHVLDVTIPDSVSDIGLYHPYALTSSLAIVDSYAFVATQRGDLIVYDVSDSSAPSEVTSLGFAESALKQISVWGDHLYVPGVVADVYPGVSVLDISTPDEPVEIAYWPPGEGSSGLPFSIERYENLAVMACLIGGVEIYDVTQLTQPTLVGNWTLWDPTTNPEFAVSNVKISWPYLFASEQTVGLYVLDISDPSDITAVATCQTPGTAMWIEMSDDRNIVYLADSHGGLRIIDVSDPASPREVGFYDETVERAMHVALSGDSVYVADGGEIGLHVIDVSDLESPMEVAYHETPGAYGHDIVAANGFVYALDFTHFGIYEVADGSSGNGNDPVPSVSVYRIHAVCPNPLTSTAEISFDLPEAGQALLQLYSVNGQRVQTLLDRPCPAGRHMALFHAEEMARGTYLLRLDANGQTHTRIVTLVN